ncbi:hypothetical protein PRVXH_000317 [Proteinivorax hydrogeniformans]|uniref:Uncharacterized protein n=1 Tax=Proteinivorax hydrogeniformans TaxID=1826727 RepID=A0AAU8HUF9_9FIRM
MINRGVLSLISKYVLGGIFMSVVASLDEIVEAMELQSDDDSPYLS